MHLCWVFLSFVGCSGGPADRDPVQQPAVIPIEATDQQLPDAFVGAEYEASLVASGGTPPLEWVLDQDAQLPAGLQLRSDGRIQGTPSEAGDTGFSVFAVDATGQGDRVVVTMSVVLRPTVLGCGDVMSGSFPGGGSGVFSPDLADFDNLEWLAVALPGDLTQRIELVWNNTGSNILYIERANEPLGSPLIEDDYLFRTLDTGEFRVELDAGTTPSLSGYEGQGQIPMLLASLAPGDWTLQVECTDGPVLERVRQFPVQLGDEIEVDYDVWGPDEGVRIFSLDPLPEWMIWDETTGQVSGTAAVAGGWEFTIAAEAADGRYREELALLSVYDVTDIGCDSVTPVAPAESYYAGEQQAWWDARGFEVLRLPLAGITPSAVTLSLTGSEGTYVGFSLPGPDSLKFYASGARAQSDGTTELVVTPRTYPAVGHFLDDEELYIIAASTGSTDASLELSLDVLCDAAPRLDMAGLPVIEELESVDWALPTLGGVDPVTVTATGLPPGLSVSAAGRLEGATAALGRHPVTVTTTDSVGASGSEPYILSVGIDAACEDATQVDCGDQLTGSFAAPVGSTAVLCILPDTIAALGFEVSSEQTTVYVDVGHPGAALDDVLNAGEATWISWGEPGSTQGVSVNPWSWPNLTDYPGLPVFLPIRAYDEGEWTANVVCE